MASFRSSIKIISDVSKLKGRLLLQRSISAERLLVQGMHSATINRSLSPSSLNSSEEGHVTDIVAPEKTWFSTFNDRQNKEAPPRPKRKVGIQPQHDASPTKKNIFLVSNPGPQLPNRYFSTDYCTRDPPEPFKGPPSSVRDCHKSKSKLCFMDTFQPKVVDNSNILQSVSRVACSGKVDQSATFCEAKLRVKPFSLCPKPVTRDSLFKCPEAPKIVKPPKKLLLKCEQRKPPPYKICPEPPSQKRLPMCLVLSGKIKKKKKPKPPPTPRRCVCADDPVNFESYKPPQLYKMNPEIPFPVCPKRKSLRELYKWSSNNKVCKGVSKGCSGCDESKLQKSATCKSIRGEPCVQDHACPYHPSPPPRPPDKTCGPVSRPTFPTGSQEPFDTQSAPISTTSARHFPSSTSEPKKVESLPILTKKVSSSTSASRSLSASTSAPRATSTFTSLPKQSVSAATMSKAGSVSQSRESSSKPTSAMAFKQSTKHECGKMAFNNKRDKRKSGGKCLKYRWPGCRVPARTDCGARKRKKKACVRIPVPTRCFSECYKGPCPLKICNPCPCVHMAALTECDIKFKTKHLQPKEAIFEERKPFILPPPIVELFVDPSIAACCEATKLPPTQSIPSPKTSAKPSVTAPVPAKKEKKGCDCSIGNFFRSLLSYLKGEEKTCPTPPDQVTKAVKSVDGIPAVCERYKTKPAATVTDSSSCDSDPRAPVTKGKIQTSSDGKCAKFRLAGCKDRVRQDCTVVPVDRNCKKKLPARPSFSECVRDDFPSIRCTECRIALKRAKSLSELKEKGLRVTPENLRVHCSMCLNPTSKGCETVTKKLDCFKVSHQCKLDSCIRMGSASPKIEKSTEKKVTSNPPRPTKQYSGPMAKPEICDKPPAAIKKDCKNMPKSKNEEKPKNLPCNPQEEEPPNNKSCDDLGNEICEQLEPYRMPKEEGAKN